MTGCDFDWMVSNHAVWGWKAPVKASVSGVPFLSLPPFFASLLPLFPLGTPDTQANWYRTRETLGYLRELTTMINFIQYSWIESK